jgi:predicted HTH domain antitoxin
MALVVDDEFVRASGLSEAELRLELALLLYREDRLTLGQASRLAAVPQARFLDVLSERGIPVHYGVSDLESDVATLRPSCSRQKCARTSS